MKSFYKWMDQLLFTKKISKYLQRKRTKSKMFHSLIFPVTYIILLGYLPGINEESNPLNSLYYVIKKWSLNHVSVELYIWCCFCWQPPIINVLLLFISIVCYGHPYFLKCLRWGAWGAWLMGFFGTCRGRLVHFPLHVNWLVFHRLF